MSTTTISEQSCNVNSRRPAVDILVEKLARRLLRWSERRTQVIQPSHERMALILENQRAQAASGSQLGR